MISQPFVVLVIVYAVSFVYLYSRCKDHLPLHKYFSNHVLLFAPLNFLFTFFMKGRPAAVLDPKSVPGLDRIKENYLTIRSEAKKLHDARVFQRPPRNDEPGYNTFEKGGWRQYPLKWYTETCRSSAVQACPGTCAILDTIPTIRSAMFTVLTPNSDKCALTLDGTAYPWRDGEDLLFDQTYLHSAENQTDEVRVILFCDVEKTQLPGPVKWLADRVNYALVAKFTGTNDEGKLSWISWAYKPIYKVRSYVKQNIKPRSIVAYNIIKFGSIALGLYLIYLLISLF